MRHRTAPEAGVTLVELAVVLAILGIVGAAVASILAWSVQVQARHEATQWRQESAQMALDVIGRLLRTAGAAGKPAIWQGEPDSLVLCDFSWAGRVVRASVRLDEEGALVLAPFTAGEDAPECTGTDLPAPVNLVPEGRFSVVRFRYVTASGYANRCSSKAPLRCTALRGVVVQVTPRDASSSFELFIALRNPGGP